MVIDEQGRSVHLPTSFVKHFLQVRRRKARYLAVMTEASQLALWCWRSGEGYWPGAGLDRRRAHESCSTIPK